MDHLYLIAGLGNPGAEYRRTRHNIGFMAVERFAERRKASWETDNRFNARLARVDFGEKRIWLCEPLTYMNASGSAIRGVADYFKVALGQLLVVVDDADLGLGVIRMRPAGASGGHHGLDSVAQYLGTTEYPRLRIGIGRQATGVRQITNYVLGKFAPAEMEIVETVLDRAVQQMEMWLTAGIGKAMSQYNGAVKAPTAKES